MLGARTWKGRLLLHHCRNPWLRPCTGLLARFYKCALQVNPYEYVKRHPKGESFANEDAYNAAVLDALQELAETYQGSDSFEPP